ncbi:MAG: hypothetical protein V4525_13920 [Pseudomonadota bacterium]
MRYLEKISIVLIFVGLFISTSSIAAKKLDLSGYADDTGAISILHNGNTVDPYFVLQALLLAHENGLDISSYNEKWAAWLIARQKLDGTFDRYCRNGPVWAPCKTADADDALLAMWLQFLDTMPLQKKKNPVWIKSYQNSEAALNKLIDPLKNIYLVSPIFQQGLFMDNLEVWSYKNRRSIAFKQEANRLKQSIHQVFWDSKAKRFLVSTQPEQKLVTPLFYPDHIAQIFPLLVNYPLLPKPASSYYKEWMGKYRALWLKQVKGDFAWGLIAVLAVQQNDSDSARCWLRETASFRHSSHWTVTDEVAYQVLAKKGLKSADINLLCN